MNCEYCQSPVHVWFQCPKKPDGWKPARLARVPRVEAAIPQPVSKEVAHRPVTDLQKADTRSPARLAKKSTATRKDVCVPEISVPSSLGLAATLPGSTPGTGMANDVASLAGTQALPVDTNSEPVATTATNPPRLGPAARKDADPPAPKPTKFDKKTWQRNYMRTYIRQYREDVKSGKRTPKPRA